MLTQTDYQILARLVDKARRAEVRRRATRDLQGKTFVPEPGRRDASLFKIQGYEKLHAKLLVLAESC